MSATISNAYRRSLRVKILAKAQAKVEAKAKATNPARASRKDGDKGKTRVKVDEEEALTASQTRTTRTRTRREATPTLIQGGTPSPLEGSLVLPHAHKRRPSNDAFPWGAGHGTLRWTRASEQTGTTLTGASMRSCHVTKRFRILATLQQGNESMYSNTSGYVHMGLRLDWGKGITGQ